MGFPARGVLGWTTTGEMWRSTGLRRHQVFRLNVLAWDGSSRSALRFF